MGRPGLGLTSPILQHFQHRLHNPEMRLRTAEIDLRDADTHLHPPGPGCDIPKGPAQKLLNRGYNNLFAVSAMGESVMNIIDWRLDDPTQTALSSAALPRDPPVLSNWQSIFGLTISSMGDDSFLIRADLTSAVRRR